MDLSLGLIAVCAICHFVCKTLEWFQDDDQLKGGQNPPPLASPIRLPVPQGSQELYDVQHSIEGFNINPVGFSDYII
jgi:hypothetical protein